MRRCQPGFSGQLGKVERPQGTTTLGKLSLVGPGRAGWSLRTVSVSEAHLCVVKRNTSGLK